MKIKINNIFKNIHLHKEKQIKRRKNSENNIYSDSVDYTNDNNYEFKRKGAINKKDKTIFNVLKSFKGKIAVNRNYYILFTLMVILAGISIYTNIVTYSRINGESYTVFNNNTINTEDVSSISEELQDTNTNNQDTRQNTNVQTTNTNTTSTSATTNSVVTAKPKATIEPLAFVKPLSGEVIKIYSADKLIYSETLQSWRTHDGVDIKANLGTNVKSVEKGIIEKIYDDSFLGTTIVIDHGQGYKSIYCNLDNNVSVKEKQAISKLSIIGKVGNTAIGEIKDEPHIHFMLMFNNKVIDPTSKIKF